MSEEEMLYFADSREWRRWLEQNHDREKGVWLIRYRKTSGKKSISYEEALDEALCFGWVDSMMKGIDDEKFVQKYSPRKEKSVWSMRNKEKAEQLIIAGRMAPAGLAKIEEAQQNGLWQNAYSSKQKEKIPFDLKQALQEDKDARHNFNNFATGYRNMYINWVNEAKTEKTRARRIAEVVKRSASNKKPV